MFLIDDFGDTFCPCDYLCYIIIFKWSESVVGHSPSSSPLSSTTSSEIASSSSLIVTILPCRFVHEDRAEKKTHGTSSSGRIA